MGEWRSGGGRGWVRVPGRVGVDTPRALGKRNEQPKSSTPPPAGAAGATYLTEREKSPWFLRLGLARKLPWTPRPLSRVSASSPLRSR